MKKYFNRIIAMALSVIILMTSITAFAENKFGIDVSYHNGTVDYVKAKENGSSFVMIRLGNYTYLDKEFWNNVEKACNAGLDFGVYMYSAAFSVDEAKIEANFVVDTLKQMPQEYKKHFTLPVAYDMEAKGLQDFSKDQLTNQVVTFSDMMIKNGYVPMVYANVDWFTNRLDIKKFKDKGYKIWLSHWKSNPDFSTKMQVGTTGVYADMWQYQNGTKHPSGLDQNVIYDINGLKHIYRLTSTKNATCAKAGSKKYTCAVCGATKTSTIKATGKHSYDKGKVTTKPTAKKTGVLTYTCKTCKAKKKEKLAKLSNVSGVKATGTKKSLNVSWKKNTKMTGYEIQYSTNKNYKKAKTVKVSKKTTTKTTIKKLLSKKYYYVRVRTYKTINGTSCPSSWSKSVKVKTK